MCWLLSAIDQPVPSWEMLRPSPDKSKGDILEILTSSKSEHPRVKRVPGSHPSFPKHASFEMLSLLEVSLPFKELKSAPSWSKA